MSKLGFSVEISRLRTAGQDRKVEELIREFNAYIGRKGFFEVASKH